MKGVYNMNALSWYIKKHSLLGLISCALGVLFFIVIVNITGPMSPKAIVIMKDDTGIILSNTSIDKEILMSIVLGTLIPITGLIIGVISLFLKGKKKALPILGILINGFIIFNFYLSAYLKA